MGFFRNVINGAIDILDSVKSCPECGARMNLEGDVLVCSNESCGYSVDEEDYEADCQEREEEESDYYEYYSESNDDDSDDDGSGEKYDEVWGEMSRHLGED